MKISRLFNSFRKKLAAASIIAIAATLPLAVSAADMVKIEADTTVANATKSAGTMNWGQTTTASYEEVVAVQVVYNNTEDPSSTKDAQNLHVKINIPTTAGTNQTVTTKVTSDNSNTVDGSATVTLDRADAYLQYIPGTATWKHADTANGPMTVTEAVSDDVVLGANGLNLGNEHPCQAGSIVVQARVMVPGVSIDKTVRVKGTQNWATSITAKAGESVQYMIEYKNTGNSEEKAVVIADKLPTGVSYVAGTTKLANDAAPNGNNVADGIVGGGISVGDYAPGANAFVMFEATLPSEDKLACGDNLLRNIATAQPAGMNYYYNTADVTVHRDCQPPKTPVYSCDLLTLSQNDHTVTANVTYTAKDGATYKSTSISWGDGTTNGETSHTYTKDGEYNVVASVTFDVNGEAKTVTSDGCKKTVTIKTPQKPVYSCDLLSVTKGDNRTVTASVSYTAQGGATFKMVTLDWGDGSTALTTDKTTANYTYAKDGTYNITAKVLFSVDGKDVYAADNANCAKSVTFTTTPSCTPGTDKECTPTCETGSTAAECTPPVLPNTGAGSVIGIFAGVVVASTVGYRLFLGRQLSRR